MNKHRLLGQPTPLTPSEEAKRREYLDPRGKMAVVYAVVGGGEAFVWEQRWAATVDAERREIKRLTEAPRLRRNAVMVEQEALIATQQAEIERLTHKEGR
jgi:hypothetical protein